MSARSFFGYGSLVNTDTHDYRNCRTATLSGWQRCWRQSSLRDTAYLSVEPVPGISIQGLIADVPGGDWAALDVRETGYDRLALAAAQITSDSPVPAVTHIYKTSHHHLPDRASNHPLLLSYLDCVVQGFLAQFGPGGVSAFFASTSGWHTPIRNDRAEPHYPRARRLSVAETALVDSHLAALPAVIE
jgi:Gamma-glutamyl cyclotransferase, AIG2-like